MLEYFQNVHLILQIAVYNVAIILISQIGKPFHQRMLTVAIADMFIIFLWF